MAPGVLGAAVRLDLDDATGPTVADEHLAEQLGRDLARVAPVEAARQAPSPRAHPADDGARPSPARTSAGTSIFVVVPGRTQT